MGSDSVVEPSPRLKALPIATSYHFVHALLSGRGPADLVSLRYPFLRRRRFRAAGCSRPSLGAVSSFRECLVSPLDQRPEVRYFVLIRIRYIKIDAVRTDPTGIGGLAGFKIL